MKHLYILILTLFAWLAIGCTSSGDSPPDLPDATTGDTAPPADDPSPLVEKLCPGACEAAVECDSEVVIDDCLAQCAKEIAGEGYLIPEVAVQLFEFINEDGNEDGARCTRMKTFHGYWKLTPYIDEGREIEVEAAEDLEACMDRYDVCGAPGGNEGVCFVKYYRYNHAYRAPILECLQADCSPTWMDCMVENTPRGQPWLTIPEQKQPWD